MVFCQEKEGGFVRKVSEKKRLAWGEKPFHLCLVTCFLRSERKSLSGASSGGPLCKDGRRGRSEGGLKYSKIIDAYHDLLDRQKGEIGVSKGRAHMNPIPARKSSYFGGFFKPIIVGTSGHSYSKRPVKKLTTGKTVHV